MNRNPLRILGLVLLCVGARAPLAGAAIVKVPQQFTTIQAAVNAASAGDTIRVSAGIYREHVVVTKKVRLEAKGNAIIEGRDNGVNLGPGIDISGNCSGTSVKGFTIRLCLNTGNTGAGIVASGSSFTFENIRVIGCGGPGIYVFGPDVVVRNCVVEGCNGGILAISGNVFIDSCVVRHDAGRGIRVSGADFVVRKCVVDAIEAGIGIDVDAFNGTVEQCVVERVQTNMGLFVDGANVLVRNNLITGIGNDAVAVRVSAANCTLEHNVVRDVIAHGMYIDVAATGTVIHANQFLRTGAESEPAIDCTAASCTISNNIVREADGCGIRITGNETVASNNTVERCRTDGIYVGSGLSGVEVTGNHCIGQLGEGIDLRTSGLVVTDNVAKQNRTDFAAPGIVFILDPSNVYDTAGTPEVD